MDKQHCQYEGCRAWPRKGQRYCVAHPEGQQRSVGGAPDGNQNARVHGLYSGFVSVEALQRAMEQPADDLRLEIAAVRAAIDELLSMKGMDAGERLKALDKGMGALARLIRIQKQVSGDDGGDPLSSRDPRLTFSRAWSLQHRRRVSRYTHSVSSDVRQRVSSCSGGFRGICSRRR